MSIPENVRVSIPTPRPFITHSLHKASGSSISRQVGAVGSQRGSSLCWAEATGLQDFLGGQGGALGGMLWPRGPQTITVRKSEASRGHPIAALCPSLGVGPCGVLPWAASRTQQNPILPNTCAFPWERLGLFLWHLSPWHLLALKARAKNRTQRKGQPLPCLHPSPGRCYTSDGSAGPHPLPASAILL